MSNSQIRENISELEDGEKINRERTTSLFKKYPFNQEEQELLGFLSWEKRWIEERRLI